jgi:hypothetical protein
MHRFGAISGKAFDLFRKPIANSLCAQAVDDQGHIAGSAETGSDGTYVIKWLQGGDYTVHFVDCSSTPYWESQWYFHEYRPTGTTETILRVGVWAGQTTTGIDAQYVRAIPAVEGTITEEGSGAPIANYCARIWQGEFYVPGYWHSDANGHYRIERDDSGAPPPGSYEVHFEPCGTGGPWLAEWYDDSYRKETSTWIQVGERGTKIANVSLARGAEIAGTVTLSGARASGLLGLCVHAFRADSGGVGPPVGGTDVFDNGAYAIQGLPGGDYKVRFSRCISSSERIPPWATQWWDAAAGFGAARTVSVPRAGSVGGVDATMEFTGTAPPPTARSARCVVPELRGLTVAGARRRLRTAGCRLGRATRIQGPERRGTVVGTRARAGRRLPRGSRVDVLVAR